MPHPLSTGIKTEGIGKRTVNIYAVSRPAKVANMLACPSWRFLVSLVALKHGVTQDEIMGRARRKHIAAARHEAMKLVFQHTQSGLTGVGRIFDRDHCTVNHAIHKFVRAQKLVDRIEVPPRPPFTPLQELMRAKALAQPRVNGKFGRVEVHHA